MKIDLHKGHPQPIRCTQHVGLANGVPPLRSDLVSIWTTKYSHNPINSQIFILVPILAKIINFQQKITLYNILYRKTK